ncbi:MAG: hypothetical protein JXL80_08400 [Planctomycetes bacterium]|nr:hypothetical protein [Planctomycetota bacterium]
MTPGDEHEGKLPPEVAALHGIRRTVAAVGLAVVLVTFGLYFPRPFGLLLGGVALLIAGCACLSGFAPRIRDFVRLK